MMMRPSLNSPSFSGIGQVRLNAGQSVMYTFQVPVTYRYSMVLRYSLFPLTWLNTLSLYDAEALTWTGTDQVSTYTSSSDRASSWNITFSLVDSSNRQFLFSQTSIASLSVGEAKTWNDSNILQLQEGANYRLAITYETNGNVGIPWPIMIDSVLLMPDLAQNSYFIMQSNSLKNEILDCRTKSASLSTAFQLPSQCRNHVFGSTVIMYNGSLGEAI